ncbi:MAG: hypothetical protein WCI61_09160 [Chloroflexota bacterium]
MFRASFVSSIFVDFPEWVMISVGAESSSVGHCRAGRHCCRNS